MSDIGSLVVAARTQVLPFLTDTCTITRAGVVTGVDPTTLAATTAADTTVYGPGACLVLPPSLQPVDAGYGAAVTTWTIILPITAIDLIPGDHVTVTATGTDPDTDGLRFTIETVSAGSNRVMRRISCVKRDSNQGVPG
jgi:hypothetical protein